MTTVTMAHFRNLGYCARGVRQGFERYGFSRQEYSAFLQNGIEATELLTRADGNAMVQKVVEVARGQQ